MPIKMVIKPSVNLGNARSGYYPNGDAPAESISQIIEDWSGGLYEIFPGYTVEKDQHIMSGIGGGDFGSVSWSVEDVQGVRSTDTKRYNLQLDTMNYGSGDVNLCRAWWRPKTASNNGLWYAHEYTKKARDDGNQETADSWKFDHYNRMRIWIKIPDEFGDNGTNITGQFDFGTYFREFASGDYNDQEGGTGWHFYHKANIYPCGINGWIPIVINFNATATRSGVYDSTFNSIEYPTSEAGYNYFDLLTNFYFDTGSKSGHPGITPPINVHFGLMEFYRESNVYNTINIGTPWAAYDTVNEEIVCGWKGDMVGKETPTCYVKYSFSDIKKNGWNSATAFTGNESVSVGSQSYQDFRWKQSAKATGATGSDIDISGEDVMYLAISDSSNAGGADQFEQLIVPLTQAGQDFAANYYINGG